MASTPLLSELVELECGKLSVDLELGNDAPLMLLHQAKQTLMFPRLNVSCWPLFTASRSKCRIYLLAGLPSIQMPAAAAKDVI